MSSGINVMVVMVAVVFSVTAATIGGVIAGVRAARVDPLSALRDLG